MAAISKRPRLNGVVDRIRLVGIELEGGWDATPEGLDIVKDGSVKFPGSAPPPSSLLTYAELVRVQTEQRRAATRVNAPTAINPAYKGEIVSRPIGIGAITEWVTKAYPKYVNETCGLHVHMSFHSKINYSRLMVPEFTPFIIQQVKEFAEKEKLPAAHPQWDRVNSPKHPHCAHLYLGKEQVKMTRKDWESRGKPYSRYTFVNYCHGQHHTVEVRGLAMMETAEQAIKAIMAVLNGTNTFLSKVRHREHAEKIVVTKKPEVIREFRSYLRAA